MIICECGEEVGNNFFRAYIKTERNPSTPTIGHTDCGFIFNFVDGGIIHIRSPMVQLKCIAARFGESNGLQKELIPAYLLEVDRLKRKGNLLDFEILVKAWKLISPESASEDEKLPNQKNHKRTLETRNLR